MAKRKRIPHAVELAAALLQLVDADGNRLIPHSHAKLMTADQIISLFARDHYPIRVADGGPDEAWNITWKLRAEHKEKTAKVDQPQLAKQRHIRAREAEHKATIEAKGKLQEVDLADVFGYGPSAPHWREPPKVKIPSRPFPKGRKFASQRRIS